VRMVWAAGAAAPVLQPADAAPGERDPARRDGGPDGDEARDPPATERLARIAVDVLDCQWSAVYLLREDDPELVLAAVHGAVPERLPDKRALLFLADSSVPPAGQQRILCTPLRHEGRARGFLVSGAAPGRAFASRDRRLAEGIAQLGGPGLAPDSRAGAAARQADVLSTVSHELRTPLNAVVGYLEMLADPELGTLSPSQSETLGAVSRSVLELRELVAATLELSRLDAGRGRLEPTEFEVEELLAELACEARPLVAPGVTLSWDRSPGLDALCTDRMKLKIVLKNLIGNALKFTEQGGVAVTAAAEGTTLAVAVRDTGIGIPPDDLPFIFERFRQGRLTPGRGAGGVGLGLHIVQRLVELLGGDVGVESEHGVGTTLEVRLPGVVSVGRAR